MSTTFNSREGKVFNLSPRIKLPVFLWIWFIEKSLSRTFQILFIRKKQSQTLIQNEANDYD